MKVGSIYYAIICASDSDSMWSNEFGWVDTPTFDLFTQEEREELNLPIEGQWVQVTFEPAQIMERDPSPGTYYITRDKRDPAKNAISYNVAECIHAVIEFPDEYGDVYEVQGDQERVVYKNPYSAEGLI